MYGASTGSLNVYIVDKDNKSTLVWSKSLWLLSTSFLPFSFTGNVGVETHPRCSTIAGEQLINDNVRLESEQQILMLCTDFFLRHLSLEWSGLKVRKLLIVYQTQWLFVQHPYGDLYLLFVRESEDFIEFLCNCWFFLIQIIIFTLRRIKRSQWVPFLWARLICVLSAC